MKFGFVLEAYGSICQKGSALPSPKRLRAGRSKAFSARLSVLDHLCGEENALLEVSTSI
jgi:hypothetical protein